MSELLDLFTRESGYAPPDVDVRGVVFKESGYETRPIKLLVV